jgi:hypothetical protein
MTFLGRWRVFFWAIASVATVSTASAADTAKFLPDRTEAVVTVNVKQLIESPLLKDHLTTLKKAVKDLGVAQPAFESLGLDPLQDVERIIIAWPGNPDQEDTFVLIQGSFDNAKIDAALQKSAKDEKGFFQEATIDDRKVLRFKPDKDRDNFWSIILLDQGMIALGTHPNLIFEAQDKQSGKRKSDLRKDISQMLAKVDPKHAVSVVSLSRPLNFAGLLGNLPGNLQNVTGGVTLGDDIKLELALSARDVQNAKAAVNQLEDTLNQAKAIVAVLVTKQKKFTPLADLLAGVKVSAKGNDVAFRVTITQELLDSVFKKDE